MLVIPAIDLKDGRCVRLRQGDMNEETVYASDPAEMALQWQGQGARWLHVVDLNGAVEGKPINRPHVEAILGKAEIPVQVGGGIRSLEAIRYYLSRGAARVVLGTVALQDRPLLEEACAEFPQRIVLGLDAKEGLVAVQGWTSLSHTRAAELLAGLARYALAAVIYTDIARDGMLQGPNLASLQDVLKESPFPVIASGGISTIDDIHAIKALGSKVEGAIVGKALYDGKLDLRAALEAAA